MAYIVLDLETCALDQAADYVEPLALIDAPSNYKDPEKIAAYIAKATADATAARASKFGLDPDLCRIVALGYHKVGYGDPVCHLFENEEQEQMGLGLFWDAYKSAQGEQAHRLVTFMGHSFDLPVLMRRSLYLGVKHPRIVLKPEWKCDHIDLWEHLATGYPRKAHSLKFYQKRFKMPITDDTDGSQIAALVADGSKEAWDAIERHCLADIETTHVLANRLGLLVL